jgi:superfamily II DNA or RNA helicase
MLDSIKKNKKVWFIVHRRELQSQAENTLKRYGIPLDNIKVWMIQTLVNKLDKIEEEPDMIIYDECQHATSNTYLKIIKKYPNAYMLGLTATPCRLSGKPLGDIFETIVSEISAKQLIEMGFLATYDYYAPNLEIDLSQVKKILGDYDTEGIDKAMSKPKIFGDIIKTYKKLAHNKKTILYCPTINYSKKMEQLFSENGYTIKHFDGKTPKEERDKIIEDFRTGKIQILTNVDLVGERI